MNSLLPAGIEAYLKEAGFSATEMLVLKKLVEEETLTVRELAAKTGKSTGVLDQSMKKLLQKGIAQKGTINGQPRYSIRSLESLVQWVKEDMQERQKMMTRKHENFEEYISSLKIDRKRPDIEHFAGESGIKQAYLRLAETGPEFLTVTPVLHTAEEDPLRVFRVELFRKRQSKKIFQRVIAANCPLARRFQSRDAFEYRKTVLIPNEDFPIEFERTIAGNSLLCINHVDKTACLIKYPELVNVEKAAFEALWSKQSSSDATGATSVPASVVVPLKTRLLSSFREFILSKRSVAALAVFAILSGVLTFGLYASNRQINLQRVRETVVSIASTGALQFDAADIGKIRSEKDIGKPEYAKLVATLNLIRRSNPNIKFAYLMRQTEDPNMLSFVADADSLRPEAEKDINNDGRLDAADALSYPGDTYDISEFPDMAMAFQRAYADAEVTEDQWGSFISGAAPIQDASGQTVAIVGIDFLSLTLDEFSARTFSPVYFFFLSFFFFLFIRFFATNCSLMQECWLTVKARKKQVVLVTLFVLVTAVAVMIVSRLYLRHLAIQETGKRLMAIAVTAADDFDPADLDQLRFARDMETEAYQRVFRKLNDIRNKNPEVKYAYLLRKVEGGQFEFIADADSNFNLPLYSKAALDLNIGVINMDDIEAENVWPGTTYQDQNNNELLDIASYRSAFGTSEDQWGTFISGFSPIILNGELVGILGLDIDRALLEK